MPAIALVAASLADLGTAAAQGQNLCVPGSGGVPAYAGTKWAGPPKWDAWANQPGDAYAQPDDPRWVGASGQSFGAGAASAAGQVRALYANPDTAAPGDRFLYLSFTSRVTDAAAPQNMWLGFRVSATEGYLVRFRFNVDPTMQGFTECTTRESLCPAGNIYTVFELSGTGNCGASVGATRYVRRMNTATWISQFSRVWRTTTQWTLNMRIPLVPASSIFNTGITETSQLYYELGSTTTDAAGGQPWPRTSGSICGNLDLAIGLANVVHPQLTPADATKWGNLRIDDTTCEGVRVYNMGILHDPAAGTDLTSTSLPYQYLIGGTKDVSGVRTPVKNWFAIQVLNDNRTPAGDIAVGKVSARFRIADWGVSDIAGSSATWRDVPVTAGANPTANTMAIANSGGIGGMAAEWTLSQADRCMYGVGDPGDACAAGSQTRDTHQCIHAELTGEGNFDFVSRGIYQNHSFGALSIFPREAMIDASGLPVRPGQTEQLVYLFVNPRNLPATVPPGTQGATLLAESAGRIAAELRAPFAGMPPIGPNHGGFDAVAPIEGPNGMMLARSAFPTAWGAAAGPMFRRGVDLRMPQPQRDPADDYLPPDVASAAALLDSIGRIPAEGGHVTAEQIFAELHQTVEPALLAQIAPTLEVYAFHDTGEVDGDGKARLNPMSSFTLFLHHDGPVSGFSWVLDGADRVSDNVYKVRIPIADGRRKVRVRAQAIESTEPRLVGNPVWPCGGCCHTGTCSAASQMSNAGLTGLAFFLAFGWKRRRRDRDERSDRRQDG